MVKNQKKSRKLLVSMPKSSSTFPVWVVQLYFVLASLLGLVMLVVGSSIGINALLSQHVFVPRQRISPPPRPFVLDQPNIDTSNLSEEQQTALSEWQADYDAWQKTENEIDYEEESRKRTFAAALGMILVGAPVFLLHVPFVFRQARKK